MEEGAQHVQDGELRALRETSDAARVDEWALVLSALGVHHVVELRVLSPDARVPSPDGLVDSPDSLVESPVERIGRHAAQGRVFVLLVAAVEEARAREALDADDREREPAPPLPAEPDAGNSSAGLVLGLALVAFYFGAPGRFWEHGAADAARIVHGEWWRAATALTLHADLEHVLGNALAGGFLLAALSRRLGAALASWLLLAAGILGNLATAALVRDRFVSIGASTSVFGALGAATALRALAPHGRRRAFVSLGAGVALLGFLGTGERADLFAHLFGFCAGLLLGAPAHWMPPPRSTALQPALAALACGALAACWWRALAA